MKAVAYSDAMPPLTVEKISGQSIRSSGVVHLAAIPGVKLALGEYETMIRDMP